jgi:hypothetical protein
MLRARAGADKAANKAAGRQAQAGAAQESRGGL